MNIPYGDQSSATRLSPQNYAFLQRYIHAESGIVIEEDKRYLLEARLVPVLREHKIESLDALTALLAANESRVLSKLVIDAMTTNETLFFRDVPMFDALRQTILPALLSAASAGRRIRIWSAAASTGQEAYSIAMVLRDLGATQHDVEIVGTDLSAHALERARKGRYLPFEVKRGLPAQFLSRYFIPDGVEWQIRNEIRDLVRFEEFDLRNDARHLGLFDLIFCRNVLIYFDADTKALILRKLRRALSANAMLALGCAETLAGNQMALQRTVIGGATFYAGEVR
ncbi:protein-glutamate O-methyltransferase CheR [Acidipila sp. EB88]|uniref:CheR family methyltransferase n=1 Tax=Acidipila sp. EB88 TaxID=2305226 RepID=UPI000F5F05D4|nr:protein-glutamate O-methyltransferase CheR [Acidipila sp. EB88]RRA47168.1 protein-glutamate O-methyltransferase CheR [Acidipila sp. EB88]